MLSFRFFGFLVFIWLHERIKCIWFMKNDRKFDPRFIVYIVLRSYKNIENLEAQIFYYNRLKFRFNGNRKNYGISRSIFRL